MRQSIHQLEIKTKGRAFHEITQKIQQLVDASSTTTGLATLHIRHTSASLIVQENADPEVRKDFERFFSHLVPDGIEMFRHTSEGPDDMPAHVRSALTAVNLSIPVMGGRLVLGTWQGIYVWEHRASPHSRVVIVHLLSD